MNMELGLISRDAFMAQQREVDRLRDENAMLIRALEGLAREIEDLRLLAEQVHRHFDTTTQDARMAAEDMP